MTGVSHTVIKDLLTQQANHFQASFLYFKHQLSLPPEHRIVEGEEEDIKAQMKSLSVGIATTTSALNELKEIPIDASTDSAN